jgi:large repetitive protein
VQFKRDGVNLGAEDTTAPYAVSWNSTTASNGSHTLTAVARDAAGNTATSAAVNVTVFNDTTPPAVSMTAPAAGVTVAGTMSVSASATDNVGVVGVQFKLDGANLGAEATTAPYAVSWTTTTALDGSHTLIAVARDAAGNTATSTPLGVTVDNTPPTVSISSPASGASVAGTMSVSSSAMDSVGVVGVQFKLDGANLGAEDTAAPYSISWNTTLAADGSHTLTTVARDAAGNTAISTAVAVTVDNAPPVLSAVSSSSVGSSSATISWTTDEASDSRVEYGPTTAYGQVTALASALVRSHSVGLSGLSASTVYHYRVKSRDAAGNLATSADFTFTTALLPDTTPPAVSITAPAAGAIVSGTITVSASATDDVGVVGVQFKLDGVNLGAELTAAPYVLSWDTTSISKGTLTLTAVARDAAGNIATAPAVSVTVLNRYGE